MRKMIDRKAVGSTLDTIATKMTHVVMAICVMILIIMIFSVSYGVLGRYLNFIKAPRWTQELAILSMVWLCFLGSGYAIKEDLHVRMSVIDTLVSKRVGRILYYVRNGVLLAVNLVWIIYGVQIVKLTSKSRMAATGWPMGLTYVSLIVGGIYGVFIVLTKLVKGDYRG